LYFTDLKAVDDILKRADPKELRQLVEKKDHLKVLDKKRGGNVLHYCLRRMHFEAGIFLADSVPELLTETDKKLETPLMLSTYMYNYSGRPMRGSSARREFNKKLATNKSVAEITHQKNGKTALHCKSFR